jgi:hypothetical protein
MSENIDTIAEWVVDTCRDLGLSVAAESDFFQAGGTSLSAIKLIARADERFGEDTLTPEELFDNSAITAIAEIIAGNVRKVDVSPA